MSVCVPHAGRPARERPESAPGAGHGCPRSISPPSPSPALGVGCSHRREAVSATTAAPRSWHPRLRPHVSARNAAARFHPAAGSASSAAPTCPETSGLGRGATPASPLTRQSLGSERRWRGIVSATVTDRVACPPEEDPVPPHQGIGPARSMRTVSFWRMMPELVLIRNEPPDWRPTRFPGLRFHRSGRGPSGPGSPAEMAKRQRRFLHRGRAPERRV